MRYPAHPALLTTAFILAATGLQAQKAAAPATVAATPRATVSGSSTHMSAAGSARGGASHDQAPGFAHISRPSTVPIPTSHFVLMPGALPRTAVMPTEDFWGHRDLLSNIRRMARTGFIPTSQGGNLKTIISWCYFPAGWWAYAFVVPPKGTIHVRLHHPNEAWFHLHMVDRWGESRKEGMLQNIHYIGNPEVSYISPLDKPTTVYVIVDDPGWMSSERDPYTLTVERSWDTEKFPTPDLPPALGIWYHTKASVKPVPPAAAPDAPAQPTVKTEPDAKAPAA